MAFYHNLITQKSWQALQELNKTTDFILIGGWAVYLYTRGIKSKDIDIIVNYDQLSGLEKEYILNKNNRLKKYEARKNEVQIDIYLPYFSNLGIPVEDLIEKENQLKGFRVLNVNYLFVLKVYSLSQRGRTPKGRKDFIDIISLWQTKNININNVVKIIDKYQLKKELQTFENFIKENVELPELNLSRHYYAKIKKDILML